jgi:hypothetical protein
VGLAAAPGHMRMFAGLGVREALARAEIIVEVALRGVRG